jgi:hypothetical protein
MPGVDGVANPLGSTLVSETASDVGASALPAFEAIFGERWATSACTTSPAKSADPDCAVSTPFDSGNTSRGANSE